MHRTMPGETPIPTPLLCPTCRKPVEAGNPELPFCSDRCRVIDLGKWASGEYRISSPIFDPELLDELEQRRTAATDDPEASGAASTEYEDKRYKN